MASFTDEDNTCGQALLNIVARGSAIIAELLRLSQNIPSVFKLDNKHDIDRFIPSCFLCLQLFLLYPS